MGTWGYVLVHYNSMRVTYELLISLEPSCIPRIQLDFNLFEVSGIAVS
jgi:hypothetical protein